MIREMHEIKAAKHESDVLLGKQLLFDAVVIGSVAAGTVAPEALSHTQAAILTLGATFGGALEQYYTAADIDPAKSRIKRLGQAIVSSSAKLCFAAGTFIAAKASDMWLPQDTRVSALVCAGLFTTCGLFVDGYRRLADNETLNHEAHTRTWQDSFSEPTLSTTTELAD